MLLLKDKVSLRAVEVFPEWTPRPRITLIGSTTAQSSSEVESTSCGLEEEDSVGTWKSFFSPFFVLAFHQDGVCGGEDAHQLVHLPALQVPQGEENVRPVVDHYMDNLSLSLGIVTNDYNRGFTSFTQYLQRIHH